MSTDAIAQTPPPSPSPVASPGSRLGSIALAAGIVAVLGVALHIWSGVESFTLALSGVGASIAEQVNVYELSDVWALVSSISRWAALAAGLAGLVVGTVAVVLDRRRVQGLAGAVLATGSLVIAGASFLFWAWFTTLSAF